MHRILVLALASLVLAGCTDPVPAAREDLVPPPAHGTIRGLVLDDERVPLPDVTLTLTEASAQVLSGGDGGFLFEHVRSGIYTLVATHALYNETTQLVLVEPDLVKTVNVTLAKRPEFRPFSRTSLLQGNFDCGAEALIVTGPCWTLVEGVTCGEPVNMCVQDPLFTGKYEFKFLVDPRWETVLAELVWETGGASSLDGMRLYVENANVSAQGM
ncbi:MAG: carboxypeptidase-like regulatory domain-containing protein, partial [bacterium]